MTDSPSARAALANLGKLGGLIDAKDKLTAHPRDLIVDANLFVDNPDNPAMTARMTFLGQFLDHDLTLDITSSGGPGDGRSRADARPQVLQVVQRAVHPGGVQRRGIPLRPFAGAAELPRQFRLCQEPGWTPNLGATPDQFSMVDLLNKAGVVTAL